MDIQLDKLSRDRARRSDKASKAAPGRAVVKSKSGSQFNRRLLETQSANIREELNILLVSIDTQAKEIEKSLTFEALGVYRELVQKFVGMAVNELYEVEEKLSVSPTGKKKSLLIVKKINAELEALTEEFMNRQQNLIAFLARLDQIRGLLLDLYS